MAFSHCPPGHTQHTHVNTHQQTQVVSPGRKDSTEAMLMGYDFLTMSTWTHAAHTCQHTEHNLHIVCRAYLTHSLQSILYTWCAKHTLHIVIRAYFTHGLQSILYTSSAKHTLHLVCRAYLTHSQQSILYTLQASQVLCHPTPLQWTWTK